MGKRKIIYTSYNSEEFNRREIKNIEDLIIPKPNMVNWIDVISINNFDLINKVGERFKLHPLIIEDILNIEQMPKVEDYDEYVFVIIEELNFNEKEILETKQLSIVLFKDVVISFQESESDLYDNILLRLKEGASIRKNGTDDLLYALTDTVVDNYFLVLELIGEKIDEIEDELLINPKKEVLQELYKIKRDLIYIRKTLWPMRNTVSSITKNDYELIDERTLYYFRDVYDHILQIIDITETYREISSGLLDTYLSSIGNKTNDIMKILTIFSTIFIPLTFLAGVYGMNFKYFPELSLKYGYAAFWVISIIITGFMVLFFKNKKWL